MHVYMCIITGMFGEIDRLRIKDGSICARSSPVFQTGLSNYITVFYGMQFLYPCLRYLFVAQKSFYLNLQRAIRNIEWIENMKSDEFVKST